MSIELGEVGVDDGWQKANSTQIRNCGETLAAVLAKSKQVQKTFFSLCTLALQKWKLIRHWECVTSWLILKICMCCQPLHSVLLRTACATLTQLSGSALHRFFARMVPAA